MIKYEIIKINETTENIKATDVDTDIVLMIPTDLTNSDYQTYLESLEPKAKALKVVDEAAPE
jgi:hypothetical protein